MEQVPKKPTEQQEEQSEEEEDEIVFLQVSEDRQAIKELLDTFDAEQLQRYEAYRRAHFPKQAIRKLCGQITGLAIPSSVGIIVAGVTKIFVGEMTELALQIMEEWGDKGPIRPKHLREAYRRTRLNNQLFKRRLF